MEINGKSIEDMLQGASSTAIRTIVQMLIALGVAISTWTINHVAGTIERQGEAISHLETSFRTLEESIRNQAVQNDLRFQAVNARATILDTRVDSLEARVRAMEIRQGPGDR